MALLRRSHRWHTRTRHLCLPSFEHAGPHGNTGWPLPPPFQNVCTELHHAHGGGGSAPRFGYFRQSSSSGRKHTHDPPLSGSSHVSGLPRDVSVRFTVPVSHSPSGALELLSVASRGSWSSLYAFTKPAHQIATRSPSGGMPGCGGGGGDGLARFAGGPLPWSAFMSAFHVAWVIKNPSAARRVIV